MAAMSDGDSFDPSLTVVRRLLSVSANQSYPEGGKVLALWTVPPPPAVEVS